MMAEETGYAISDIKYNSSGVPCITLTYTNLQGRTHLFGPGEDFMMDGFYLAWNPSNVELGHYYERLVCTNGQTVSEEHKDASVYKLSSNEIRNLIGQVKSNQFYQWHRAIRQNVCHGISIKDIPVGDGPDAKDVDCPRSGI